MSGPRAAVDPGARRAAVDVGTNSVRLLVVEADGSRVTREMTITRLGTNVDRDGRLDDAALQRTLDTLGRYREIWERHGVTGPVRIAATSAVRDAADRDRFFEAVREVTGGMTAEVLSGEDEARTSFRGATAKVDAAHPVTVVDVGGGSTELVVGDGDGDVRGHVSLQLGCVRLTERLLPSDPPGDGELDEAADEAARQLVRARELLTGQGADPRATRTLIGVAGTVTTLAALHLDLDEYEEDAIHGTVIPRDDVAELTRRLAGMRASERAELGPMAPGREDVIVGGALIVRAVLDRFGFDAVVASEADILDGLAMDDADAGT